MATLYVVFGSEGEWSDHNEWMCAAYADEAKANEHAVKAKAFSDAWYSLPREERLSRSTPREHQLKGIASPFDPHGLDAYGQAGYVDYSVTSVELLEEVPT